MKWYTNVYSVDVFAVIEDLELIGVEVLRVTSSGIAVRLRNDMKVIDEIMSRRGFI